ncbi:MAG: SpoIID/LytB domain-containing protein [Acidimicrobiales bacterium]
MNVKPTTYTAAMSADMFPMSSSTTNQQQACRTRIPRLPFGLVALVVVLIMATLVAVPVTLGGAPADAAEARPTVVIDGRGWGHGRGMSQYGALGYATDFGWSSAQILDHYYGGTTAGQAPIPGVVDPRQVRVDLVPMKNRATTVALESGTIKLMAADGSTLRQLTGAVRLTASGGSMSVQVATSCSGPWTSESAIDRSLIRIAADPGSDAQSGLLQVCGPSYRTWYEGEIWATATSNGQRTVNVVTVETYLRGVVPNEVPALWDSAALEAQAVAARSYVLAGDHRWTGYADTCDSTTCQVYDGRYTTRGAGFRTSTHSQTDAAVAATTDLVRLNPDGTVARTEFSSSSGGYTAGGDFPAVPDDGDDVDGNTRHDWTRTVDLSSFEASSGLGRLLSIEETRRNGYGEGGGRVTELMARPLIASLYPHLDMLIQPLSGEFGGRRDLLRQVPFCRGYAVDLGLLIDLSKRFGDEIIAQVDLGSRVHRNRPLRQLGPQSAAILAMALRRSGIDIPDGPLTMRRPEFGDAHIKIGDLPPLAEL